MNGIIINGAELKISQFADDTQLMASDYPSLRRSFEWAVERYAEASSGKPNEAKYEGLRMGSYRRKSPPEDFKRLK